MNLYRNGYVVAEIDCENRCYHAWPLADIPNDKIAEALTNEADDNWFIKYEMQHIVPDLNYIRVYADYCNSIGLQVKILLFESADNNIIIEEKPVISEVLGFDCIGTVYYSYLQTEYSDFKAELSKKIFP